MHWSLRSWNISEREYPEKHQTKQANEDDEQEDWAQKETFSVEVCQRWNRGDKVQLEDESGFRLCCELVILCTGKAAPQELFILIRKGQSKHKIRTFVVGWICRNLRAFWEDQTDQKSALGGPNQILRTGPLTIETVPLHRPGCALTCSTFIPHCSASAEPQHPLMAPKLSFLAIWGPFGAPIGPPDQRKGSIALPRVCPVKVRDVYCSNIT